MWRMATTILVVVFLMAPGVASAAPGDLDDTFSDDGWVRTLEVTGDSANYLPDGAASVAITPDDRIVTAGEVIDGNAQWYFGVFRYLADGELDTSFGEGGWVANDLGSFEMPRAVEVQSDGKIVVGGDSDCPFHGCFTLARYLPNGMLDPTFGGDGIVQTIFRDNAAVALDIDLAPGGKIVAAGFGRKGGDALDDALFALARYKPNGALDKTFSGDGKVTIDFGFGDDLAYSVQALSNGKIVAAGSGTRNLYVTDDDFAIAQLRADGSRDRSFSGNGLLTVDLGSGRPETAFDVVRHRDGFVVAGSTTAGRNRAPKMGVVRIGTGGQVDRGFGLRRIQPGRYGGYARAAAVDGEGRILLGGRAFVDSNHDPSDWIVTRLLPGGSRDSSWSGGLARVDFGTGADQINDLVFQNGKLVAAGSIYGSLGLARFQP